MLNGSYEEIGADVIVSGGAITGLFAAIKAKEQSPELNVVIIDKGTSSASGCANWAGGDITFVKPDDDLQALIDIYMKSGDGLADPKWLESTLTETYPRVLDLEKWGLAFERDEKGEMIRKGGRGGGALSAVSRGSEMLKTLRKKAENIGVKFLDKVMITDLLVDNDIVGGVIGFKIGTDKYIPYVVKGKSVVIASGPCSFKAAYLGHRMATGDGVAAAFRHGAEVMGMEFGVGHNTGPRTFDLSGLARWVAMGAKFINASGEEFMWKYDPVLGNKANWYKLNRGMAMEVKEGRGPIYFDMTSIKPEDLELSKRITPHTFTVLERIGLDFTKDKIEWIPCFAGTRASSAGLRIREDTSTTIPGVYAGGDSSGKYHYGACAGYHGYNFGWCAVSGDRAGRNAAAFAKKAGSISLRQSTIDEALIRQAGPLNATTNLLPEKVIEGIQEAIIPYDVILLKEAKRLEKAIEKMKEIGKELVNLKAVDTHSLMKAHEAMNMNLIGQLILKASLARTETRGGHYREDYPERDDANWGKWIYMKKSGEKLAIWVEDNGSMVTLD